MLHRYWRKILAKRDLYKQSTTNEDKTLVAQTIVDLIKSETGRFLQKEKKTELWFELPDEVAMSKVKQALRDKHVPKWFKDGENEEEGDVGKEFFKDAFISTYIEKDPNPDFQLILDLNFFNF